MLISTFEYVLLRKDQRLARDGVSKSVGCGMWPGLERQATQVGGGVGMDRGG